MSELLGAIRHFASIKPNDIAIIGHDESVTWHALMWRINFLTKELSYFSGQVVALYADNSPDWIAIDLACHIANITLLPLPSFFSQQQLNHAIRQSGAKTLIVAASASQSEGKLSNFVKGKQNVLSSAYSWLVVCELMPPEVVKLPTDTQKITYTSGSTGEPKGVCLSGASQLSTSQALIAASGLRNIRHLAILPFSTLLENIAGIYAPILSGGQIIALPQHLLGFNGSQGFMPSALLDTITSYQPSSFILLPELLTVILGGITQGWQIPQSIEFIAVGGSKVPTSLLQNAETVDLPVYQGYGLSECASVVSLNTPKRSNIESTGYILEHLEVEIEQEEIVVSGNSFLGYIDQQDTWYQDKVYTGDLGFYDSQGYLHITGRKKNVLVSSFGRNISPEWIESELLSNGLLAQCVVLGDAEPFCSALVLPRNTETTEQDIEQWINQVNKNLPDYAQIKAWQKLPSPLTVKAGLMTSNGRPIRSNILEHYQTIIQQFYQGERYAVL
jgi:long-subunit acyl-CoA synthetase (AMP-forming)